MMKKVLMSAALVVGLIFGLGVPAFAASGYHTYQPSNCQIKISGFEDWGKAAASTRDNNSACWQIQAQVKYKDSSNNFSYLTGGIETDSYTKIAAGIATDWDRAYGRSPNLSSTWWYIQR